ncbi:MAG: M14 family zinc carboxypeptidase, partial [Bacteroidota bacterium]
KKIILLLVCLPMAHTTFSQELVELGYYLPKDVSYNPAIPTPKEVLGHEVGQWHVTHDKLIQYMGVLAQASDRIAMTKIGQTFEGRPLVWLTITSPENQKNIETIKKEHLALSEAQGKSMDISSMPAIVYQGFSIHGNEPSGSNAALAYAYFLAAAESPQIEKTLGELIILLDPCLNPDGLQRFAYWANTNKSQNLNPDNNDREYHEVWPGGRTNHYWFDMNRDWLPVQLPESRARIASFHEWLPNIVTDHHEMGTNSTFFFQPGEPSRVHPLTPALNQELTAEMGTYHASALDKIGSLYYSEEDFDDFYYGKGSTFPDINGSIGILFEQASSRGHVQESENGLLSFPFTIRNQFTTALSTIRAAEQMRPKILDYHRAFYEDVRKSWKGEKTRAWIFGDSNDAAKAWHLAEVLQRHNIDFYELKENVQLNDSQYIKGHSYVVPLAQKNKRLIQALFEKRTSFADSVFYDISAWTFPLAFNLDYNELQSLTTAGKKVDSLRPLSGAVNAKSDYAYIFQWHGYYGPKVLNALLDKELRAKVARYPFSLEGKPFDYGTILIPVQNQEMDSDALHDFLEKTVQGTGIEIFGVNTGLATGIDLGSNRFEPLTQPKVALLVGQGVHYADAGEIWHLLDTRYAMKVSKIDIGYLDQVDLAKYTHFILPSSSGKTLLNKNRLKKLKEWVKAGGNLIGYRNMTNLFQQNELLNLTFRQDTLTANKVTFGQKRNFLGAQHTGGAIFQAKLDRSHPINFGYKNKTLPLFRNSNIFIEPDKESFNNPIQYTRDPLLSGYISEENLAQLKGSVPFQVQKLGKGKVFVFTDNTNFRAFWYGTNKLLMNAIFFGKFM